jgi:hypothetical protein
MSAISASDFAGGIDKTSLKDHTSRSTSEDCLASATKSQPHPATLLGLPQELRDKIFEHAYESLDSPDDRIRLTLSADNIYGPRKGFPGAAIPSSQAPPSKDPLLVCRQLYIEMGSMQAAAYRQYWSKNTFDVSLASHLENTPDIHYSVADRDLNHIKCFTTSGSYEGGESVVEFEYRFRDGGWMASFDVSNDLWNFICGYNSWPPNLPRLRGRSRLIGFEREMRRKPPLAGPRTMNPDLGDGFIAEDMCYAAQVSWTMMLLRPLGDWIAL